MALEHEVAVRQSAEEALRAADERKDEFIATLAHELRNPLAPLRNALGILRATDANDDLAEGALEVMDRQLRQLVRLVDDLLDVARITTGKIAVRREPELLGPIIQSALDSTSAFMRERGHEIEVRMPGEAVPLYADATRLEQVFVNLLHNAAKFTEPGGRIRLEGERDGDEFVVTVADSGIGISAEMLPVIFAMFTQLDRSLERPHAGLGVGLSLARRLIELHGGSLTARSEGAGKGSSFLVRLPMTPGLLPASRSTPAGPPAARQAPLRILVADDNQDCADTIAVLLRMSGHEVQVAYDGQEASEAAHSRRPDVAVLDIGLPKLNGYELARRLRDNPLTRPILLLAMTGWGQDEDRRRARDAGFDHHLVKPVDPERLLEILAAWRRG